MARNDERKPNGGEHGIIDRSRRRILQVTGAGVGIVALGGTSAVVAGQEEGETPTDDEEPADGSESDDHFLADLVDPVFGYPLAAGETDDVSLEHVVDVTVESGIGSHDGFPREPDPEAPGEFVETPAEFLFDPVGLHVEPGDLVHFNTVAGLHTVTAFHEKFNEPNLDIPTRVPADTPAFTSPPLTPGESWVYRFTESGVYDYLCLPHLGLGMVARIVVFDPEEDDVESEPFEAPTAGTLLPNDERVLAAAELDPANVIEAGSVAWEDVTLEDEGTPTGTPTEDGIEPGEDTEDDGTAETDTEAA